MARPARHDVDYFPFIAKKGQTQCILESKFGLEGTGFLINLFCLLAQKPDHYFWMATPMDKEYFFQNFIARIL